MVSQSYISTNTRSFTQLHVYQIHSQKMQTAFKHEKSAVQLFKGALETQRRFSAQTRSTQSRRYCSRWAQRADKQPALLTFQTNNQRQLEIN